MIDKVINIGDRIDLFKIEDGNEKKERKQYLSQILDFMSEDKAKLAMPIENGKVIPLTVGDRYELCFYTSTGLYQCKAEVTERYKENNVFILVVQFASELEKCQRRQFYRLEYIIDMQYRVFTREEEILIDRLRKNDFNNDEARINCEKILETVQEKWENSVITDISGGGIRFNSSNLYKKGQQICMKVPVQISGQENVLEVKGNVVLSEALKNKKGYFETRVEFVQMDRETREYIVRFIFEEERKKLRRSLV